MKLYTIILILYKHTHICMNLHQYLGSVCMCTNPPSKIIALLLEFHQDAAEDVFLPQSNGIQEQ